jgi:two-component system chemotaxis response regulator CheY
MATALVVDDSSVMRRILRKMITELGFDVREAENGRQALALLAKEPAPVSLSLVDWNMPEMDGLELLKHLRSNPELGAMVVIMVTSDTELAHIAQALEAGANEYVMKPFTRDILVSKLELAGVQV